MLNKMSASLFMGLLQAVNIALPQKKKEKMQQTYATQDLGLFQARKPQKKTKTIEKSEYFAEVYLTNANQRNGPGHISASLIQITNSEPTVITHTSYMPDIAGIINGVFLGFVPVLARNFPNIREEDINKADSIIRIPLSKEEFEKGVERQQQLEKNTDTGLQMYAITGASNPVASFIVGLFSSFQGAKIASKNFEEQYGIPPSEDYLGNEVTHISHHPEEFTHTELLNCTAAVQSVFEAAGIEFDEDYVIPGNLAEQLEKLPDSKVVTESLVNPENNKLNDDSFSAERDIPEP